MKSEPDRLDFLIVVLPFLLVGLLGFQAYEYIQMDRQRAGALPVSSAEPPAAEPPEVAPPEAESGDAATATPATDDHPGDAEAGDTAEQSDDTVTADPGTTDSPGVDAAPAVGEPAVDTDQAPNAGEPAAANPEPPAVEVLPPTAADTQAPVPAPPALQEAVADVHTEVLLQPQTNPAKVGELFAVDVLIREASEASGTIFHLRYDKRMLQLNEDPQSEMGPFFADPEGGTRFNATVLGSGKVVVSIRLAQGAEGRSGDGVLVTFYFVPLMPGETRLDLLQSALRSKLNRLLPAVFSNATLLIVE